MDRRRRGLAKHRWFGPSPAAGPSSTRPRSAERRPKRSRSREGRAAVIHQGPSGGRCYISPFRLPVVDFGRMRVSAVLGFIVALLVGTVALGAVVVALNNQPPITGSLPPTTTPAAIVTPSPKPTVAPTAITSSPSPSPSAGGSAVPVGTEIGQLAPDFVLPGLSGGEFQTANSKGKPLWVNFMATWCPQCQDELPMMSSLKLDVGDAVDLVLVDVAEDKETVLNFMTGLSVDLPTALDSDSTVQKQW